MAEPLPPELAERFDAWLEGALARQAPLGFRDLRKGAQSLSGRYVERRDDAGGLADALGSPARRAAFATYYAGLHLLTAWLCAREQALAPRETIIDLGAGTGAAGAGSRLGAAPAFKM